MEEDEDDFYGVQAGVKNAAANNADIAVSTELQPDAMEVSEEEDSDDDVQFTLEKPVSSKTEAVSPPQTRAKSNQVVQATKADKVADSPKLSKTKQQSTAQTEEPATLHTQLLHKGKEGKDYPETRTSEIKLDNDPTWPGDGKKITELDIDTDLVEHSKPWRLPGTDITDYFNYGFDEYTWVQYCARQRDVAKTITDIKDEDAKMKSMMGADGMPDMNQMMQMMMGGGMGADPSKMDFGQMMMGMGMPQGQGMPGFPPSFPGQQNSNSPIPPNGQAFQPPTGPGQGQIGFPQPGMNMDGFNPQQMAMMQQEQQSQMGGGNHMGGGGRTRNRRGRGYY